MNEMFFLGAVLRLLRRLAEMDGGFFFFSCQRGTSFSESKDRHCSRGLKETRSNFRFFLLFYRQEEDALLFPFFRLWTLFSAES